VLAAMTTQQISRAMHIGFQTVAKHKQHILRKLGVRNEVELVLQIVGDDGLFRRVPEQD
jgi:DNA-binding NarL/FixJ family response regulator